MSTWPVTVLMKCWSRGLRTSSGVTRAGNDEYLRLIALLKSGHRENGEAWVKPNMTGIFDMYQSIVQERGKVRFADFSSERIYMREFTIMSGLPHDLSHWQETVDDMLTGIETDESIYLMVDQQEVKDGQLHRRPGMHVDGYWNAALNFHGGGHEGRRRHSSGGSSWSEPDFSYPQAILLASDVSACIGYEGSYDGLIGEGGSADGIYGDLTSKRFESGKVYAGNVGMLHESIPMPVSARRTVVRLNVYGWTP